MSRLSEFNALLRETAPRLSEVVSLLERGAGAGFGASLPSAITPGQTLIPKFAASGAGGIGTNLGTTNAGVTTTNTPKDEEAAAAWFLARGCRRETIPSGTRTQSGDPGFITGWMCPDGFHADEEQFHMRGISSGGGGSPGNPRARAIDLIQSAATTGVTGPALRRAPSTTDPNLATADGQVAIINSIDRLAASIERSGDGGAQARTQGFF